MIRTPTRAGLPVGAAQVAAHGVDEPACRPIVVASGSGTSPWPREAGARSRSYQPATRLGAREQLAPGRGAVAARRAVVALPEVEHRVAGEAQRRRRR